MKLKFFLLFAFLSLFLQERISASTNLFPEPPEMAIFNLEQESPNWKEISRYVSDKQGIAEFIPDDQEVENWSDLIRVQFVSSSLLKREMANSIDTLYEAFRMQFIKDNPGKSVLCNIISKGSRDLIYEVILPKQSEEIPLQHEIVHMFLTDHGSHSVAFCRQYSVMSPEEKEKWIRLLKDSVVVGTKGDLLGKPLAFSLAKRIPNSSLADNGTMLSEFPSETISLSSPKISSKNWKECSRSVDNSQGFVELIPVNQSWPNWSELITLSYFDLNCSDAASLISIENIVKDVVGKKQAQFSKNSTSWSIIDKNKNSVVFEVILKSSDILVPPQHQIARIFLTSTGFHSIEFTRKNREMSPEERWKWIDLLKGSTSVVSFRDALKDPDSLSLTDKN